MFAPEAVIDGVTFAPDPGRLLAPLRATIESLGMPLRLEQGRLTANGIAFDDGPALPDGTRLIPVRDVVRWGVGVSWDKASRTARLVYGDKQIGVRLGEKRVTIDKTAQEILATQGGLTVLRSRVSTGREGRQTPNGHFTAGPYKARMHRSSLFANAPMPYSVQIEGDIFVHGYASVPDRPASHGCIRLPLDGTARFFYTWIELGTPVTISGRWQA